MLKRKTLLLTALLCLTLLFTACSENKAESAEGDNTAVSAEAGNPEDAPVEAEELSVSDQYLASLPATDYGGYGFRLLSHIETWITTDLYAEEENGDVMNDTVFRRNVSTEELLNIALSVEETSNDISIVKEMVQAGDNSYDLVFHFVKHLLQEAPNGNYRNLNAFESIDLSHPWWDREGAEMMTLEGRLYGAFLECTSEPIQMLAGIFFNKDMLDAFGMESPYTMVREGTWTNDKMLEMTQAAPMDLDGDGAMTSTDQYGYVGGVGDWSNFLTSGGLQYYETKDDGTLRLTIADEPALAVMEVATQIVNNTNTSVYLNESGWGYASFEEGRALLIDRGLGDIVGYRDLDLNYGVVPFPKASEQQERYYAMMSNCSMTCCVPMTCQDLDMVGTVAEVFGAYSYPNIRHAYYEVVLKDKLSREPDMAEMLDLITTSRTINLAVFYEPALGSVITGYLDSLHKSNTEQISSFAAKQEKVFQKQMDKIIEKYKELEG